MKQLEINAVLGKAKADIENVLQKHGVVLVYTEYGDFNIQWTDLDKHWTDKTRLHAVEVLNVPF